MLIWGLLLASLSKWFKMPPTDDFLEKLPLLQGLLIIPLLAILEELIFRLPLRFSWWASSLWIGMLSYQVMRFWFLKKILPQDHLRLIVLILWLLLFVLLFYRFNQVKSSADFLARFHVKIFPVLFYGSTLAFGLAHIANYTLSGQSQIMFTPLITFPQLFAGFVFAYLRVRQGLFWSILLHIYGNLVLFLLSKNPMAGLGFLWVTLSLVLILILFVLKDKKQAEVPACVEV